ERSCRWPQTTLICFAWHGFVLLTPNLLGLLSGSKLSGLTIRPHSMTFYASLILLLDHPKDGSLRSLVSLNSTLMVLHKGRTASQVLEVFFITNLAKF
ncbi:hypothetical protein Godav_008468, partial [Gossypium davidsonii]|nr:hypothetical protein [Gossypium davidsonii]MBA0658510.1 hypothetical protein [Gossypium klotzschianum]